MSLSPAVARACQFCTVSSIASVIVSEAGASPIGRIQRAQAFSIERKRSASQTRKISTHRFSRV